MLGKEFQDLLINKTQKINNKTIIASPIFNNFAVLLSYY
jgi:hypothetical protein